MKDGTSNAIDDELLQNRLQELFKFKILLLGPGESGKSTIVKQLRAIHNKKYTEEEKGVVADSLHNNVVECLKAMVFACKRFGIELGEGEQKTAQYIVDFEDDQRIPENKVDELLKLWESKAFKEVYTRRNEYWLLDSMEYYMENLERFCEEEFEPSDEDCIMARIRTTGIVVSKLEQKHRSALPDDPKVIKFEVVDVGGQRNERKKWIHCFDDVKAILFVVNLAGYNQVMFEDNTKNRMAEALELFKSIVTKQEFANTPIVLFLNKKDLFESMLVKNGLETNELFQAFPKEDSSDVMKAIERVKAEFNKQLPQQSNQNCRIFAVTGVWRKDIQFAFEEVKKELLAVNRDNIEKEKKKIYEEQRQLKKAQQGGGCVIS